MPPVEKSQHLTPWASESNENQQTAVLLHGRVAGARPRKRRGGTWTHWHAHLPALVSDVD